MEYRQDATFKKPSIFRSGVPEYVERLSSGRSEELNLLAEETRRLVPEWADIATSPVQTAFLQMLISACGVRRILEIGTFTGLGTLGMAAALPAGGEIVTVDNYATDPRARPVAERAFRRSPYRDRITQIFEDGATGLKTVDGTFGLIFLDADKPSYIDYYETILDRGLLGDDGMIVVDNTLWGGEVLNPRTVPPMEEAADGEEWVERMFAQWAHHVVAFNQHVADDPRTRNVLLTVQDGMTLIRPAR